MHESNEKMDVSEHRTESWLAKENNLMNHLVYISRLMKDCDLMGDLLNEKEWTKNILQKIRSEQDLIRCVYVKYLGGCKRLHLLCNEDVLKQWIDYVEQSADFWNRWQWKCWWL
jgi:hypothetical protein